MPLGLPSTMVLVMQLAACCPGLTAPIMHAGHAASQRHISLQIAGEPARTHVLHGRHTPHLHLSRGAQGQPSNADLVSWSVTSADPCMASKCLFCPRVAGAEGQLSIADLVRGLGDQRARLGPARKTLERLARKAEPVAPPLPGPVQRRQERRAGYEHAKEDVAKWQSIVKVGERIFLCLGTGMARSLGIH